MSNVLSFATAPSSNNPDKDMENYLNTLFDRCKQGFVEFRQISIQDIVTKQYWMSLSDTGLPDFANDQHIYVGVATREKEKGSKTDIVEIPAVWIDVDFKKIDKDEVDERIEKFSLQPSMIVSSGNGYHLYWILNTPAKIGAIPKIEDINKRLVNHFDGDGKATDAARIMRLPGTYNVKYPHHPLVIVSSINDKTYRLDDFDFLPPVETQKQVSSENQKGWYDDLLQGVTEGQRNGSAVRLVGRYMNIGLAENETQIMLSKWNEQNKPPLLSNELENTIADLYRRYGLDKISSVDNAIQDFKSVIESSIISVHKFAHKQFPARPFIIHPVVKKGELVMIAAGKGVGKTWLALSLGFAATRHATIGPWKSDTLTGCLFIDGEMAADDMQSRIHLLAMSRQKQIMPFEIMSVDEMRCANKPIPNLTNPKWREELFAHLKSHPEIELLILDNLASLTAGRDENRKKEWDDINQWLLKLRSNGIAVIFLHHTGKSGEQRGTSAIEDNINNTILLKHPEGYQSDDDVKFKVSFDKKRGIHGKDVKPFTLNLQYEGAVLDWKVIADDDAKKDDQIIEKLKQGMKPKDIAKEVDCTPSWVSQVTKKVREEEQARRMKLVCGDGEDKTKDSQMVKEVEQVNHEEQPENSPDTEEVEVVERQD